MTYQSVKMKSEREAAGSASQGASRSKKRHERWGARKIPSVSVEWTHARERGTNIREKLQQRGIKWGREIGA